MSKHDVVLVALSALNLAALGAAWLANASIPDHCAACLERRLPMLGITGVFVTVWSALNVALIGVALGIIPTP
jgi:hypothetical protein